jgi:hypothetical protein
MPWLGEENKELWHKINIIEIKVSELGLEQPHSSFFRDSWPLGEIWEPLGGFLHHK